VAIVGKRIRIEHFEETELCAMLARDESKRQVRAAGHRRKEYVGIDINITDFNHSRIIEGLACFCKKNSLSTYFTTYKLYLI